MSDDLLFAHVASRFFGVPLLLRQPEAEVIAHYLRSRMLGAGPDANRFVGREEFDPATRRWKGYRRVGSVGIVSIIGELVNRGAWLGAASGLTSYEGILAQVRAAAEDSAVKAIVLDINSPGGEAAGMADTARQIRKIAGNKRLVAVVNSMAASAAYGLATAAHEIVIGESGIAGSIGVLLVHADRSRQLDAAGITMTVFATGTEKAAGNPYEAMTDEHRAALEREITAFMVGFARLVTSHRPALTAERILDLEGGIRLGADAVKAGLADRIGTFDDVITDLQRQFPAPIDVKRMSQSERDSMKSARFKAVASHPRLADSKFLRSMALDRAKYEPLDTTADDIVEDVIATYSSPSSPSSSPASLANRGSDHFFVVGPRTEAASDHNAGSAPTSSSGGGPYPPHQPFRA